MTVPFWALLAPIPGILLGGWVAAGQGVSWLVFIPNAAAVLLGVLGVELIERAGREGRERAAVVLPTGAVFGIAVTLLAPGLDGVRRWVAFGPIRLNMSAALAPCLFLGLASSRPAARVCAMVGLILVQLVHFVQPDAAQASALAVGLLPALVGGSFVKRPVGALVATAMLALAAATWTRPDPLLPVEHVERILWLAASRGAPWAIGAALAVAGLLLPFALGAGSQKSLALSLALYTCTAFVVTFFGYFPVPVIGAGAGPVLGWYALVGALLAALPRQSLAQRG